MDCSKIERINSFIDDLSINESFIHPNSYFLDTKLKIYEDEMHEFKQFTIIEKSELVEKIRNLSKYLCAFLNSNSGVIYLGINDDGLVKGIKLSKDQYELAEFEIGNMINSFEDHVVEGNYIMFQFCQVHRLEDNSVIEDLYVIEILVKHGMLDHVYTTPFKDVKTNDYQCYIKLNGTKKKIEGQNLYKYLKNKIRNFVKKEKAK
jgi:predicted HTH transcriptional regulator